MPKIAVGFRVHSGWAAMVAVTGSPSQPVILDRRRIEIAEQSASGPVQPYHTAREMGVARGGPYLEACRETSLALASAILEDAIKHIGGDRVQFCAILTGSGHPSPNLEATLASHPAMHAAEGEFYREILHSAAESRGLRVRRIKEKELFDLAAHTFDLPSAKLHEDLDELGKIIGPPWQQDQKFAALAAWLAAAG
jgi:hypothetical protein